MPQSQRNSTEEQNFISAFENLANRSSGQAPAWIQDSRKKAIESFARNGLPTKKDEHWKYTNIAPITDRTFRFAEEKSASEIPAKIFDKFLYGQEGPILVFVHGLYSEKLSVSENIPSGLRIRRLSQALKENVPALRENLGRFLSIDQNGFNALNQAFFQDGAFIHLEKGAVSDTPIQIVHIAAGKESFMAYPRHLILAGENSRAVVIENFISLAEGIHFSDAVTEILLEQGAQMDYYKIIKDGENFHVGRTEVRQNRDSHFKAWSLVSHGRLVRNDLHVDLAEEGASAELNGLYLVSGERHVDNHILVDHLKPHGTSRQIYKGILRDRARAVFNGKAFVHPDAQKADAQQLNKNLLLSDNASVDAKPELEICADDVKCSHGAAIGQLDESQVFYLKSRGMSDARARKLLAYGFASEIIQSIRLDPVREEFDHVLFEQIEEKPQGD